MTQKQNGPATAPTVVPSQVQISQAKESHMNSTINTTGAAKAPAPSSDQIADAMNDLEASVYDLLLMADIAAELASMSLNRPDKIDGSHLLFRLGKGEREKLLFAINNVEDRARTFKEAFMAARYGEDA